MFDKSSGRMDACNILHPTTEYNSEQHNIEMHLISVKQSTKRCYCLHNLVKYENERTSLVLCTRVTYLHQRSKDDA